MQEVISETLVDSIPKDGLFDILLHYGLFLGALFQLVCIFAVTFVPARDDENVSSWLALPLCLCSGSASGWVSLISKSPRIATNRRESPRIATNRRESPRIAVGSTAVRIIRYVRRLLCA